SSPKSESISVTGGGSGGGTGEGGLPGGPNRAPRADFRADPTTGDAPLVVSFSNRSTDPDGDLLIAHWDFGDGFRSSEASPRHPYTSAGEYTVMLTVTDARGLSAEPKREDVTVRAGSGPGVPPGGGVPGGTNHAPRADFRADPPSGAAPLIVTFSNRSTDADGDTLAAHWDFGDGSESNEMSPTHTYASGGAFTVTLVVTDGRGLSSEPKRENVTVRGIGGGTGGTPPPSGPNHPPRADFRADHPSGPAPLTVAFSNMSTDPDGELLTSLWDFGDGTVSSEPTPTHTYTSAGSFTVVLVVTDSRGMSSEPKRENITARPGGPLPPTTTTLPSPSTTSTTTPPTPSTTTTTPPPTPLPRARSPHPRRARHTPPHPPARRPHRRPPHPPAARPPAPPPHPAPAAHHDELAHPHAPAAHHDHPPAPGELLDAGAADLHR